MAGCGGFLWLKMGGPTQVPVSHWSGKSSKTPIPAPGKEKSQTGDG